MLTQTVAQMTPLLHSLQQPAFCLCQDGTVVHNRLARHLCPQSKKDLELWLGNSRPLYEQWDRRNALELSLTMFGETLGVTIQALQDGTLFLMNRLKSHDPLSTISQTLRQPLSNAFVAARTLANRLDDLEDEMLRLQLSTMIREVFRIERLSNNLADFEHLQELPLRPKRERLDAGSLLRSILPALEDVFHMIQRPLDCQWPSSLCMFSGDRELLIRAIYNLMSNALKYSINETPIFLWAEPGPSSVLFRVRNQCSVENSDLLSAAFSRMEQRTVLPDREWGPGLGLPLVQRIAQLHGGTVALEVSPEGEVTVTMSVVRKRASIPHMETPILFQSHGGLRTSLVELSDALPPSCFLNLEQ